MSEINLRITHVITFAPEVMQLIGQGYAGRSTEQGNGPGNKPPEAAPTEQKKTRAAKAEAPKQAEAPKEPEIDDLTGEPINSEAAGSEELTLPIVRAKASEVAEAGKREKVKALLEKYGASTIKALEAKHYPAVMKALEKM